jgi:hypothetical protein
MEDVEKSAANSTLTDIELDEIRLLHKSLLEEYDQIEDVE